MLSLLPAIDPFAVGEGADLAAKSGSIDVHAVVDVWPHALVHSHTPLSTATRPLPFSGPRAQSDGEMGPEQAFDGFLLF